MAGSGGEHRSANRFEEFGLEAAVVVYFADRPSRRYQVEQWLPVLEVLDERHPVLIATRSVGSFEELSELTPLPIVFARRLRDLEDVLTSTDAKVCLYVNNSTLNFQALSWRRALHAHLNHGESDKISMASNQVKAYDAVFVAGEAAEHRYRDNLLAFEGAKLVRVGRPQLDLDLAPVLSRASRPTLMYAPTWEGDTPSMDYTSLPRYGLSLVQQVLTSSAFRVVYKPHPRVIDGSQEVVAAHNQIVRALEASNGALEETERHVIEIEDSILPMFADCDVLVSDVSSVALDWLYLRTEAPLWVCDPYDDREELVRASPLAAHTSVLDGSSLDGIPDALVASIGDGALRDARETARRLYFGDLAPGDSTRQFLDAVDVLVARREELLAEKQAEPGVELRAGVA